MYAVREQSYTDFQDCTDEPDAYQSGRWAPQYHLDAANQPPDMGETMSVGDDDELAPDSASQGVAEEEQDDDLAVNARWVHMQRTSATSTLQIVAV